MFLRSWFSIIIFKYKYYAGRVTIMFKEYEVKTSVISGLLAENHSKGILDFCNVPLRRTD